MIRVGNTFLIGTPPNYKIEHLFIVIAIKNDKALLVNVTSNSSDKTCLLTCKDHSFLQHNSYISYKDTMDSDISAIDEAIRGKAISLHSDVSPCLLSKIQNGAKNSPHLTEDYLSYLL